MANIPSTTSGARSGRMSPPPGGHKNVAEGVRKSFRQLARRNWQQPLTAVLQYGGGSEHWVIVKTRGAELRVPGFVSIADVLAAINSRY